MGILIEIFFHKFSLAMPNFSVDQMVDAQYKTE